MAERTKPPIAGVLDDCARLDRESEKGWDEPEILEAALVLSVVSQALATAWNCLVGVSNDEPFARLKAIDAVIKINKICEGVK